jgi:hypothetical protein
MLTTCVIFNSITLIVLNQSPHVPMVDLEFESLLYKPSWPGTKWTYNKMNMTATLIALILVQNTKFSQ